MLISSNAITARSIGLVMSYYIQVKVNIDDPSRLVHSIAHILCEHTFFFFLLLVFFNPLCCPPYYSGLSCFTWDIWQHVKFSPWLCGFTQRCDIPVSEIRQKFQQLCCQPPPSVSFVDFSFLCLQYVLLCKSKVWHNSSMFLHLEHNIIF